MRRLALGLLLLLLSQTSAGAFTAATLRDTFTAAGPTALTTYSANWSGPILSTETLALTVTSNVVSRTSGSGNTSAWWNVESFGPDMAATMSLPDSGGAAAEIIGLYVRTTSPNEASLTDGYRCLFFTKTPLIRVDRIVNSVSTTVTPTDATRTLLDGHQVGCEVTGTGATVTIIAWVEMGAGWVAATTVSDTHADRPVGAGFAGFIINNVAIQGDDFGACTLSGGACVGGAAPADFFYKRRLGKLWRTSCDYGLFCLASASWR